VIRKMIRIISRTPPLDSVSISQQRHPGSRDSMSKLSFFLYHDHNLVIGRNIEHERAYSGVCRASTLRYTARDQYAALHVICQ
jgi:hypothetical protein